MLRMRRCLVSQAGFKIAQRNINNLRYADDTILYIENPKDTTRKLLSSVQFNSVSQFVSDSLRPHESQHARPPCPSPTPGVHSDSHPTSR